MMCEGSTSGYEGFEYTIQPISVTMTTPDSNRVVRSSRTRCCPLWGALDSYSMFTAWCSEQVSLLAAASSIYLSLGQSSCTISGERRWPVSRLPQWPMMYMEYQQRRNGVFSVVLAARASPPPFPTSDPAKFPPGTRFRGFMGGEAQASEMPPRDLVRSCDWSERT